MATSPICRTPIPVMLVAIESLTDKYTSEFRVVHLNQLQIAK